MDNKSSATTKEKSTTPALVITPAMTTPLPFVSQFPISTVDFVETYKPHTGNMTPAGKFATPTATTQANIAQFLTALVAYEQNPTATGVTTLNNLLQALDMSAIRLEESPNDAVIFYPNPTANDTTPIVTGCTLVWRFGATQVPGETATYSNPLPPVFIYEPHPGQDRTLHCVTTQFAAGAKGLLSHYFNPNVAPNPDFKGDPITATNIKRFSDPSHSDTTAFVPFVEQLYKLFPYQAGTVSHGMLGTADFQIFATNNHSRTFLENGDPDYAALLSLAVALQQNSTDQSYLLTTDPYIATLCAPLPGYVIRDNQTFPLTSDTTSNTIWNWHPSVSDNTDAVGHMADGATPFYLGTQTDNILLIEFGGELRGGRSTQMPQFAIAQMTAASWRVQYDSAIHNLWQLEANFPDVYNNMTLYPQLFNPEFIAEYKANGTNPFNTSSSAAAAPVLFSASSSSQPSEPVAESSKKSVLRNG